MDVIFEDQELRCVSWNPYVSHNIKVAKSSIFKVTAENVWFKDVIFEECTLSDCVFSSVFTKEINFDRCTISDCKFDIEVGALLNMRGSSVSRTEFDIDMVGAVMSHTNIANLNLSKRIMTRVRLHSANISDTNFSDANLVNSTLTNVRIEHSNLSRASLFQATISGTIRTCDFRGSLLAGVNLGDDDDEETESVSFYDCDFSGCDLNEARCIDVSFVRCTLPASARKLQDNPAVDLSECTID